MIWGKLSHFISFCETFHCVILSFKVFYHHLPAWTVLPSTTLMTTYSLVVPQVLGDLLGSSN